MGSILLGHNEFEGLVTNNVNWAIMRLHQQPGLGEAIAKEEQDHQEPDEPWMEPVAHMLILDKIGDSLSRRVLWALIAHFIADGLELPICDGCPIGPGELYAELGQLLLTAKAADAGRAR